MREILGKAKTIRELLKGIKYSIDYYQREYRWQEKHIKELIQDLSTNFLEEYRPEHPREAVGEYGHYFLGSIIVTRKESTNFVVDGQQRLTSITLILIYLHNLQRERDDRVNIDELIYSEKFGKKSFNLNVKERNSCMEALFDQFPFDEVGKSESVQNIVERYQNIEESFPDELIDNALPYFVDWLIENVHLVEITAYSDDDAYTIFETMNDRGLSLTPTEMLKGFLLSNITDIEKKNIANALWKKRIHELNEYGKEADSDCFKAWLRSQYADKIRERKQGAKPEEFDRMGTEFHRWLRENRERIELIESNDFVYFIEKNFDFYSRQYMLLMEASKRPVSGLEHVLYNAHHGFTLQHMLLLAPLRPEDSEEVTKLKIRLVAMYIDILLTWRLWNFRTISYSTMQYTMFRTMQEIRGLQADELAMKLKAMLDRESENFDTNDKLYVHQQNRKYLHRVLARMTDYVELQSGMPPHYVEYVTEKGQNRYEVEHIWANKPEEHVDEFPHPTEFIDYRNKLGGLLLLPKSFNASYGALPYESKLSHYYAQNLLARSLHPQCYEHNPGFRNFIEHSSIPFRPHESFKKADFEERFELYKQIAKQVWNPEQLLKEAGL